MIVYNNNTKIDNKGKTLQLKHVKRTITISRVFLPAPPQSCAKTKLSFKIFEITKLPLM